MPVCRQFCGGCDQKGSIGNEASGIGVAGFRYERKACHWKSWLDNVLRSLCAAADDGNFRGCVARNGKGPGPAVVKEYRQNVAFVEAKARSFRSLRWPEPNFPHAMEGFSFDQSSNFGAPAKQSRRHRRTRSCQRGDRGVRRVGRQDLVKLLRGTQQKERGKVSHLEEYLYCSQMVKAGICRVGGRALCLEEVVGSAEFRHHRELSGVRR
ncbi:hypothetical protein KXD40_005596 [Peronospora effusa]|nr:hypothetical protein KXD40_005596 [Peronospora effusa]